MRTNVRGIAIGIYTINELAETETASLQCTSIDNSDSGTLVSRSTVAMRAQRLSLLFLGFGCVGDIANACRTLNRLRGIYPANDNRLIKICRSSTAPSSSPKDRAEVESGVGITIDISHLVSGASPSDRPSEDAGVKI